MIEVLGGGVPGDRHWVPHIRAGGIYDNPDSLSLSFTTEASCGANVHGCIEEMNTLESLTCLECQVAAIAWRLRRNGRPCGGCDGTGTTRSAAPAKMKVFETQCDLCNGTGERPLYWGG